MHPNFTTNHSGSGQELTHGEIMRILSEIRDEIRELRHTFVSRDLHDAHYKALQERIQDIEKDRRALRHMTYTAIFGIVAASGAQIFTSMS